MTIKIVGLVGEPETGKDTIADIAIAEFDARRISFAEKIYSSVLALDPIVSLGLKSNNDGKYTPQMLRVSDIITERGWRAAKDDIPEVRRLLQRMGTEVGRELIDTNIWVSMAFRTMLAYYNGSGGELNKFVFTDVRFPNEEQALRSVAEDMDGELLLVRVKRPGKGVVNAHASESSYDSIACNAYLDNEDSLEFLKHVVVNGAIGNFFRGEK